MAGGAPHGSPLGLPANGSLRGNAEAWSFLLILVPSTGSILWSLIAANQCQFCTESTAAWIMSLCASEKRTTQSRRWSRFLVLSSRLFID
jgi:hypothetical protein